MLQICESHPKHPNLLCDIDVQYIRAIMPTQIGDMMVIDLDGPEGNGNVLIGLAIRIMKQDPGFDAMDGEGDYDAVYAELTSDGYGGVLRAFHRHFGLMYLFVTKDPRLLAAFEEEGIVTAKANLKIVHV